MLIQQNTSGCNITGLEHLEHHRNSPGHTDDLMSSMMAQSDVMNMTDGTLGVAEHSYEDGLAHKKLAVYLDSNVETPPPKV